MATRTCSYWFEPASCSAGGSRQEAFINKEAYEEWQSKVVAAFYEEGSRCTELFPQTGAPSVLRKRKFILYAREDTAKTARLVELKSGDLPEKTSLMMYHVGCRFYGGAYEHQEELQPVRTKQSDLPAVAGPCPGRLSVWHCQS